MARECFPTHWNAIYFLTTRGHHCPTVETDIISLMLVVISKFPLRTVRTRDRVSQTGYILSMRVCETTSPNFKINETDMAAQDCWLRQVAGGAVVGTDASQNKFLDLNPPGFGFSVLNFYVLWLGTPGVSWHQRHACLRLNGNSKWVMGVSVSVTAGVSSSPLITLNWKVDCTYTSTREETCEPPKSDP